MINFFKKLLNGKKIDISISGAKFINPIDLLISKDGYKHFKEDRDALNTSKRHGEIKP